MSVGSVIVELDMARCETALQRRRASSGEEIGEWYAASNRVANCREKGANRVAMLM